MTSNRPYRSGRPLFEVLKEMRDGSFGQLDPYIVDTFIQKIIDSIIGTKIELNDGRLGTIVMVNKHDPLNPLVRIEDKFLDISKENDLQIRHIL
jgi:HD-GYP domain-containing protein (c-di-GMP phosphodiesterase class II)